MAFILALDQGTTSSRAIVFDQQGGVVGIAQREFEQKFPQPGWVEHDPLEIWESQRAVMEQVLQETQTSNDQIKAIGITNQRETTIVWDRKTGQPIHNAIVWQDRRTAPRCEELKATGFATLFQERTGLVLDAYFSGTKIEWILDHVDGARQRAEAGELAFGTVDSWLVWNLTGGQVHITDVSNASRTLLLNIHSGEWDDELLQCLNVPRSILPEIRGSSEVYGNTTNEMSPAHIPIAGIAGDQQAALFGQMCTDKGMVKNTYGTGCFMLMNTGSRAVQSQHNLLTTVAWKIDGQMEYALEGSVFVAGAVVQWLRDGLELFSSSAEIEALAASVDDNGGVYVVPAFVGLGTPHWDPFARGLIAGVTRGTSKAHIARAALEGIAYQVADVLDAMQSDSDIELSELRVDGGASANNLLMQFQSDLLGVPIIRPQILETTARGVAYLAGLAVGFWPDRNSIASQFDVDRQFTPSLPQENVDQLKKGWEKALSRSKGWADD